MSESERIILRKLIERLERELAHVGPRERRQLRGEDEEQSLARGLAHMFDALDWAKEALASGDDEEIHRAALYAPTFLHTAHDLSAEHARRIAEEAAQALASRRGAGQAARAQQRLQAINALAAPLIEEGLSRKEIAGRIAGSRPDLGAEGQIRRLIGMPKDRT